MKDNIVCIVFLSYFFKMLENKAHLFLYVHNNILQFYVISSRIIAYWIVNNDSVARFFMSFDDHKNGCLKNISKQLMTC